MGGKTTMNKKLILATTSPYRKEAFAMLGIPFEIEGSNVEEYFDGRPDDPSGLVSHLAKLKAEAVSDRHNEFCTIIGFDSVGWFNQEILEKPKSQEEAFERLKALSGSKYQFLTGIHIIDTTAKGRKIVSRVVVTEIEMRVLTDAEINWYLKQDANYNTYAQGYDPLGTYGSTFIKSITGSYNNPLRGIPIEVIVDMLKEAGFEV
jgi:septum formation protein